MLQEQEFTAHTDVQRELIQQPQRIRISLLIGGGITLIIALLALCVIFLFNPFHTSGAVMQRPFALLSHLPIVMLVVLVALLVFSLLTFVAVRPAGLIVYLRRVHKAQKEYHDLYTPLTALANIRRALDEYAPEVNPPTVTMQEEQVSILDLVQQQDAHQLILGVPGAGKTMALRVYQYTASQQPLKLALKRERIPVYVPMKNYSLYLKKMQPLPSNAALDDLAESQVTILDFLYESDLPGMSILRPYMYQLMQQGRLLLLCDGLNEVDSNYLSQVSRELVELMRSTQNRLVMTCREVDYREQSNFVQLVDEGQAECVVIYPLQPEQVSEFVENYVTNQGKQWRHTAGQIMQVIDRSRLRYHCTNPMMLFTLMGIIDKIGVERGKQIDTRGRLLREYAKQLIEYEQQQAKWNRSAPQEQEVIRFLSEVACAARWANDRNAIQLRVSAPSSIIAGEVRGGPGFIELADELQFWLDEHPAQGPFTSDNEPPPASYSDVAQLLQFSLSAALIEMSPSGVLSFRHELIAEYFVAEYFFAANKKQSSAQAIREDLLENVGRWSEPVAIWAGLQENPLLLADRFGTLGGNNPAYVLQALALALVCVGVLWTPPQAEVQRTVLLPSSVEEALSLAVRNRAAREELAHIFTRCAEEGGQEVYRSLLPLLMVEGVDELLALLDQSIVPDLLFAQLQDAVDDVAYEAQVKRLVRVLARFGGTVVDHAIRLSQPAPARSIRLRAAAINILGGTNDARAVASLIARLNDTEAFIVERATNALIRLGPALTLTSVLQELENRTATPLIMRIHRAALTILGRFLDEQAAQRKVSLMQYQRILDTIVPVLTSNYQSEPEVQQQAIQILIHQGREAGASTAHDTRSQKVIEALLRYLPSQNEVAARNVVRTLQDIGAAVTPFLLVLLDQQSEVLRTRVVEIFKTVHDTRALPYLLHLVSDPAPSMQQPVAQALRFYAPESVPGLIQLVLSDASDSIAERAAQILSTIGEASVLPIVEVLLDVVPERTRLLVQVLEQVHDARSLPSLITLLQTPHLEPLLAIAIVHTLTRFIDTRVVPPLLGVLSDTNPLLYEEGIIALSQLGMTAFDDLVAALDVTQESLVTQRVRRALLGMEPFPGEQLVQVLEQASEPQAQQILIVFKMQGLEAAQVLVRHLLDRNERVRTYVQQALNDMPGPVVVPALLEGLSQLPLRKLISSIMLQYTEAISPLVELLGEHERGDVAAAILPQFGPIILQPLVSGLDDQRSAARERALRIIVTLVRQSNDAPSVLHEIVSLFNPRPPEQAHELLLDVLTNELADISLPALLDGLEDAHLIASVAEAFVRLARKAARRDEILDVLLQALFVNERRHGAEDALISIGAPAVPRVGELIVHQNQGVARAAKLILRDIGVAALPFIWNAHSDKTNAARRDAALEVFHSMPTEVIKDELVALLISNRSEDIAMAISLLLDRIHDETQQPYSERVMIPELIDYAQTHGVEETNQRIIALLLLLGEHTIFDHLVQSLDDYPQRRKQLTYVLLLLGAETQEALLQVFNDPETTPDLQAELAAILGMMIAPEVVVEFAQSLSQHGSVATTRTGTLHSDPLAISLRALGGLLAGGHWNSRTLLELRDANKEGSAVHELASVLLGRRYAPQMLKLQEELEEEKDLHKKEVAALALRLMSEQRRAIAAEDDLEKMSREHGFRGDELEEIKDHNNDLQTQLARLTKEHNTLNTQLRQAQKESQTLRKENQTLRRKSEDAADT